MNIDQLRRDLAAKQQAASAKYAAMVKAAKDEDRPTTAEERAEVEKLVADAAAFKDRVERAESDAALGRAIDALVPVGASATSAALAARAEGTVVRPSRALSWGDQFVGHPSFEFFRSGRHKTMSAWRSESVELFDRRHGMVAATLTEDPASGGKLVLPQNIPGILEIPQRRLVVADLLAQGTTDSNLITYMVEKSFVNAADTVAEGAVKPESTLTFDAVSDPVRKIAHWLPITEEMLEDAPQTRSYVDARLRVGIELAEEDQLLNGSTTAPDIVGIRNRTGLAADVTQGAAPDSAPDAIYRQMMAIFTTSFLIPDGLIVNPADWAALQLMKDTTGNYIGGGPFTSPAGPNLWGVRVVVTPAIPAKTVLVGAYATGAQVFRKGGIRVEASNSHQDFFIKNLVAIRAEERLALAVYRPGAFGEVILL